MTTQFFGNLMAQQSAGQAAGTPLDYEDRLRLFLDAEQNVLTSGVSVTSWTDDDPDNSNVFDAPSGARSPEFEASSQNGLPGVNFQQPIGQTFLNRKITANASALDNFFSGSGIKSLAFAAKLNRLTDTVFGTDNTLISKGFRFPASSGGWHLIVKPSGTLTFSQRRSDGSSWSISVSGFYSVGDLVLGYLTYDGGNTVNSGQFRLFNGSDFVTLGNISTGTTSGIGVDTADVMTIGNVFNPSDGNTNAPWEGPIFGIWMTREANNAFDESYMQRWIP